MSKISLQDFENQYQQHGVIGKGTFGKILKVKCKKTGQFMALKRLGTNRQVYREDVVRQINIQLAAKHPLVVEIFEYYETVIKHSFFSTSYEFGILMQLGKEPLSCAIEAKRPFTLDEIIHFAINMVNLFAYLQKEGIAHRDIKPANFIIFDKGLNCKLADFGLASNRSQNQDRAVGSYHYASPNLKKKLLHQKLFLPTNVYKDDVYSFGTTMIQLITGVQNFQFTNPFQILIQKCKDPHLCTIVSKMLTYQQQQRPDFIDLLKIVQKTYGGNFDFEVKEKSPFHSAPSKKSKQTTFIPHILETIEVKTVKKQKIVLECIVKYIQLPERSIIAITTIQGYYICALYTGELIAVPVWGSQLIVSLGTPHGKFLTVLYKHKSNKIYSGGSDERLLVWDAQKLAEALNNHTQQIKTLNKNLFSNIKSTNVKRILSQQHFPIEQIKIDCQVSAPISSIGVGKSEEEIAVGFYDGRIWGRFYGCKLRQKMGSVGVSALLFNKDKLWIGTHAGMLTAYNIDKMIPLPGFHDCESPISNIHSHSMGVDIVTFSGHRKVIDHQFFVRMQTKLTTSNILCVSWTKKDCFAVQEQGLLYAGDQQLADLQGRGWNCVTKINEESIAIGSYDGRIAIVSW